MTEVDIVGASMTRFGKFPDSTIRTLAEEAVAGALDDAGLAAQDVEMVFFSNAVAGVLTDQEMIRGQAALRHTGLLGLPMVNVENACASASTAFHLAVSAVASGSVEVAIAVGSEKLTHEDKSRSFAAIGNAVDLFELEELKTWMRERPRPVAVGGAGLTEETEASGNRSFFMDIYAARTRAYMERTGATREDFAQVAVKSHDHASLNPKAQYRTPVTVDEVLNSRMVTDPLTLLMCSPIGDGAAAVVVCSAARAKRLTGARPVRVRSCILTSGTDGLNGEAPSATRASQRAYEVAGIGPDEVDVIELHDAAAPAELMIYESIGLCAPGDGPALLRSGETRLGGKRVVNPSGGLLSKGHPIGATGCAQIVELVDQLRGRCGARQVQGARVGLAENGGGSLGSDSAAMVVTVLGN
jgi:acetyl-CoA acetyltransferase